MSSRVFLSPETELFFVKTHVIHALAETTSKVYYLTGTLLSWIPGDVTFVATDSRWKNIADT